MPRDPNGNTQPIAGSIVNRGDTVLPSQHNPPLVDLYAMMAQSLSRDGQGGMRANLNMNGFRISNVGNATQPNDAISLSQFQSGTPVGSVVDYAGANAPDKWMFAYGQAISRTAYPDAFAAIGTRFGAGDGTTTFNLPDLRGRVIVGKDDMGGSDSTRMGFFGNLARTIGGVFGSASHVLLAGQLPRHSHPGVKSNVEVPTEGWGAIGGPLGQGPRGKMAVTSGDREISETLESINQSAGSRVFNLFGDVHTGNSGNGEAHTNTQPSIVMNKIIKVLY